MRLRKGKRGFCGSEEVATDIDRYGNRGRLDVEMSPDARFLVLRGETSSRDERWHGMGWRVVLATCDLSFARMCPSDCLIVTGDEAEKDPVVRPLLEEWRRLT